MNAETRCLEHALTQLKSAKSTLSYLEGMKTIKDNLGYLIEDVQTRIKELEKENGRLHNNLSS